MYASLNVNVAGGVGGGPMLFLICLSSFRRYSWISFKVGGWLEVDADEGCKWVEERSTYFGKYSGSIAKDQTLMNKLKKFLFYLDSFVSQIVPFT